MKSSSGGDGITDKKFSFSTLKVDRGDILFCVSTSFVKLCAQWVFLIFSLYIILKHFFPSVFKKFSNELDKNTLDSIKYAQGYLGKWEEEKSTKLKDQADNVFEDALEELCTNAKQIEARGESIPVENAADSHKGREYEEGKCDNRSKEHKTDNVNMNTNYNIQKKADATSDVKGTYNISTVDGKDLNKKENSDNNTKEDEGHNLILERSNSTVNIGTRYFIEREETTLSNIRQNDEKLNHKKRDDRDLKKLEGNVPNGAACTMELKNITTDAKKGEQASTGKQEEEGKKAVQGDERTNYPIKNDKQQDEITGPSYSWRARTSGYNNRRKLSTNSLDGLQQKNETEKNKYELKEGEQQIQHKSVDGLSTLIEKPEQTALPNNNRMELHLKLVKKEIMGERKNQQGKKEEIKQQNARKEEAEGDGAKKPKAEEEEKKKDKTEEKTTGKPQTKEDKTEREEAKQHQKEKAQAKEKEDKEDETRQKPEDKGLGRDVNRQPMEQMDKSKNIRRAISLDTIYKSDLEAQDDEIEDDKSDEWKRNEWNKWLIRTEEDWKLFNKSVENKKNRWLEKKDNELEVWLINMQDRWMHYRENEKNEYQSEAMKNSSNWHHTQWEQWIKTEGRRSMEEDLKKWLNDKETFLDGWLSKEWVQWKDGRMLQWLSLDWKNKENETFEHYNSSEFTDVLHGRKRKKWTKWKERTNKEKEEWNNWVRGKENLYVNHRWDKWLKWKRHKRALYSPKFVSFINKWVDNKQWKVWIEDQKASAM
ncbi:hypothetical protein C922_04417 [Plasmodium inui San Antonio 1]|uniref:Tryptophan/threonine-rich plasmodium antigen C-terminal domain-containing protein n=1 Tax=Plasmodium inui San Antonio 1 TaxID=1237626 RepID=W7AIL0_9APIC|nr:hypothetical protein C922_04417 [Plasmodium inui San Antonio 1]EUD65131.1 hypothetical protein C922_04417 [Plasmodium inui San Antonio 1]